MTPVSCLGPPGCVQENTEKLFFDLKAAHSPASAAASSAESGTELPSLRQRTAPQQYSTRRVQRLAGADQVSCGVNAKWSLGDARSTLGEHEELAG